MYFINEGNGDNLLSFSSPEADPEIRIPVQISIYWGGGGGGEGNVGKH